MKIKNGLNLFKEKSYTTPVEKRKIRYDYHTLRDYPFGIIEQYEYIAECDIERIEKKIASLDESPINSQF